MLDQFANAVEEDPLSKVSIDDIPKISLITSVFDGDEFIQGFLEDITRQTIFKDKCELVLVNANSPGNEEEVIKKYMEKYDWEKQDFKKNKKDDQFPHNAEKDKNFKHRNINCIIKSDTSYEWINKCFK